MKLFDVTTLFYYPILKWFVFFFCFILFLSLNFILLHFNRCILVHADTDTDANVYAVAAAATATTTDTMPGDSMMYQHTVSGIGCSGNSPTSTPPNINACSSSTPPLANSNHQNNNSSHENNSDQLVRMRIVSHWLLCFVYVFKYPPFKKLLLRNVQYTIIATTTMTAAMVQAIVLLCAAHASFLPLSFFLFFSGRIKQAEENQNVSRMYICVS